MMNIVGFLLVVYATCVAALWPVPSSYQSGSTVLWMSEDANITYGGYLNDAGSYSSSNSSQIRLPRSSNPALNMQIVTTAVARMRQTIFNQSFVPWKFNPRHSNFEPSTSQKNFISSISITQTQPTNETEAKPLTGQEDESYSLNLTTNGQVAVSAPSAIGIARALTTFTQLFYAHSQGGAYTKLAPVTITDAPKFSFRGLNLDVSRSYYPVNDIMRTIDALAYNKFNRLHLHITDAQSWPLEIPSIPELAQMGSYGTGLTYSPEQLSNLQSYGQMLGVEVYIETDMPGHTSSIAFSRPDLIAAFNVQPNWSDYAAEPPSGTLKLNSSAVYSFLDELFADILPRVAPYTAYYHTGGDEVKYSAYQLDPTVNSSSNAVIQPLLQKFVDIVHGYVRKAGLTPISWEEMILSYNLTLGKDVLIQTWVSNQSVLETVQKGYKAIAGNYEYWYLDCGHGQWVDFAPGMQSASNWPYLDYCDPLKNWKLMYSYDPLSQVPEELQYLVVGGETHMWSEQTDPINLDRNIWPRASAAGEVLWSGAKDAAGNNRSQIEASPRLADMRERLVARGVMAEPIQMPYCTQNGTQCALF